MKHILFPFITLAAVLPVSCNLTGPEVAALHEPVSVNAVCAPSTRVPLTETALPTTRQIVMAAYHNATQGTPANYFKDVTFAYNTGTLWACNKYWPLNGSLDFLGYSMDDNSRASGVTWNSSNYTSGVTLTMADNHTNQDDLLVGGSSANTATSTVMAMKHAQSYLVFKVRANVAYNATNNFGITVTDVKVNDAFYSGTVACTRTDGDIAFTWSDRGSKQTAMTIPSFATTNVTSTSEFQNIAGTPGLLVVPQDQTTFTVYYTLHNGKDNNNNIIDNLMQYTYTPPYDAKWEPMKKYIYQIDMTLTGITVNVSVTDWDEQDPKTAPVPDPVSELCNGHKYVDLGLVSGGYRIYFATMNLGASSPEEYGDYYAWGETTKRYTSISGNSVVGGTFTWATAPYHTGSDYNTGWTKYIPSDKASYWSGSGDPDNKLTLELSDDVAREQWGGGWRVPTATELSFLVNNCTWEYTADYEGTGVKGYTVTGTNGKSIFLPFAGYCYSASRHGAGAYCYLWSSSLYVTAPHNAWHLNCRWVSETESARYMSAHYRHYGFSVRAVLPVPSS